MKLVTSTTTEFLVAFPPFDFGRLNEDLATVLHSSALVRGGGEESQCTLMTKQTIHYFSKNNLYMLWKVAADSATASAFMYLHGQVILR
jgi:hypothetical protein